VFVVAGSSTAQQGPVAALVSTAGWAAAGARVLGQAWIETPGGTISAAEARREGTSPMLGATREGSLRRRVPVPVKTAVKDLRSWRRARSFAVAPDGPWTGTELRFVWQRHELFQDAGVRLARSLGVPSVLFVPATVVWEAERWGTRRPGWSRWAERRGERPALLGADLVAVGSGEVAEQVERLGVPAARVLHTPSGVDLGLFDGACEVGPVRQRLGLGGRFVVGWTGSFRRFHAVEQAVDAAATLEDATLLLVGDGPERARVETYARDRRVPAVFTGTVAHADLPAHLAAMDVALLLAPPDDAYHYSPLKLAEYLAAGRAVVAPALGQPAERLTDEVDAILVPPHDPAALSGALQRLRADPGLRARLGARARTAAVAHWSWDAQIRRVLDALAATPRREGGATGAAGGSH